MGFPKPLTEEGAVADVTMPVPRFHESGAVARRLRLSTQRVNHWADELGLPGEQTSAGTRLWTEQTIMDLERLREERVRARVVAREPQTA